MNSIVRWALIRYVSNHYVFRCAVTIKFNPFSPTSFSERCLWMWCQRKEVITFPEDSVSWFSAWLEDHSTHQLSSWAELGWECQWGLMSWRMPLETAEMLVGHRRCLQHWEDRKRQSKICQQSLSMKRDSVTLSAILCKVLSLSTWYYCFLKFLHLLFITTPMGKNKFLSQWERVMPRGAEAGVQGCKDGK